MDPPPACLPSGLRPPACLPPASGLRPLLSWPVAWLVCVFILALPATAVAATPGDEAAVRRFSLVVGANDGGFGRVQLLYAHSDAVAVHRVLCQLGGVAPADGLLLLGAKRSLLAEAFERMEEKLSEAKGRRTRLELIFYYSGHSDEQGLLLAGERYEYPDLRAVLQGMPADVRIAVLDSCASGALTRTKGGKWRAPFLVDEATQVKGHAYLTSTSADEAAQESDRVQASFFTHFMVSGLRGAADFNTDGRVTLSEAYQYAFQETLARTQSTQAGPQHPSYDFHLSGAGDLVLTDLRKTTSRLLLPEEVSGRVFLSDAGGRPVAEINKSPGRAVSLGLEPGDYGVVLDSGGRQLRGMVSLPEGAQMLLAAGELVAADAEHVVARGYAPEAGLVDTAHPAGYRTIPAAAGVVPGVGVNPPDGRVHNNVAASAVVGFGGSLSGGEVAGVGAIRRGDVRGVQASTFFNAAGGNLRGMQASMAANGVLGDVRGFQAAAGLNLAGGELTGVQWALAANYAGSLGGAQLALANVAGRRSEGLQAGLVNYAAQSSGIQLGLVNMVGEQEGDSIGLLSFVGNGMLAPALWVSDVAMFNLGVKLGGRHVYNVLGGGFHSADKVDPAEMTVQADQTYGLLFWGLGGHFDLGRRFWLEIDGLCQQFVDPGASGDVDLVTSLRAGLGWRFLDGFSLFFGPSLNLTISQARTAVGLDEQLWNRTEGDLFFDLRPGFIAGIQAEPRLGRLNPR